MADDIVGRAWWELGAHNDQLDRDLRNAEQQVARSGTAGAQSFEKPYISAQQRVVSGFGKVSTALASVGLAIGISSAVAFFDGAISKASDLAETTSKVNIVFGKASAGVLKLGEDSADALGMSEAAALSAAGVYGNLFRAMGITEETSGDMSTRLVQLAADLASFNNMDPTEVLDKLRAGLSGETEPLRTLGINLNMARINAKAMELGLASSTGELTAAAKAQATYALILEDTALAQGDFARTSDGLANSQRSLAAAWEDLQTDIGAAATGPMTEIVNKLREWVDLLGAAQEGTADYGKSLTDLAEEGRLGVPVLDDLLQWTDRLRGILPATSQAWIDTAAATREGVEEIRGALSGGADAVQGGARNMAMPISTELFEARRKAVAEVRALPGELAKALRQGQADVDSGMSTLTDLMENSLSDAAKVAHLKGVLASQELAAGLLDERADVRAAAMEVQQDALDQLELLESGAADAAVDAGTTFAEQLDLKKDAARTAAMNVAAVARGNLGFDATSLGMNVTSTYAEGLKNQAAVQKAIDAATYVKNKVGGVLAHAESPWYTGSRKIGEMVAKTYGEGLALGLGRLSASGVLAALGGPGMVAAGAGAGAMAAVPTPAPVTASRTNQFVLHYNGEERVFGSPFEAIDELTRLGAFSDQDL